MKVKDLIRKLKGLEQNAEVQFIPDSVAHLAVSYGPEIHHIYITDKYKGLPRVKP
jgi:hypothetical protein